MKYCILILIQILSTTFFSYGKKKDKTQEINRLNELFIQTIQSKDIAPLNNYWLNEKEQKKLSLKIEKIDSICFKASNPANYNLTDLKNNLQYQIKELHPTNITFERTKEIVGCAGIKYNHSLYNIENKETDKTKMLQIISYFKKKKIRLLYYIIS